MTIKHTHNYRVISKTEEVKSYEPPYFDPSYFYFLKTYEVLECIDCGHRNCNDMITPLTAREASQILSDQLPF